MMARYKPTAPGVGDPPRVNQRIDDVIYTYNRQTNTLNSWHYPTSKNAQRFQQINGLVRQLDQQYAGLSPVDQAMWDTYFDQDWWNFYCWIWQEDGTPKAPDSPGLAAFRATNLCRFDQGLATVTTPPAIPILGKPDSVEFDTPQWQIRVKQIGVPYVFNINCSIYGYPANSEPSIGEPPSSKFKYIGEVTVVNNVWTDISPMLDASGIFGTAPFKVIEVRAGVPGSQANVRGRTST
jgi:hypothetical protein